MSILVAMLARRRSLSPKTIDFLFGVGYAYLYYYIVVVSK